MNYSSLLPVLQVVLITVWALIEVAPARRGGTLVATDNLFALAECPRGRPPLLQQWALVMASVLVATKPALAAHGYSSKLHLNSE